MSPPASQLARVAGRAGRHLISRRGPRQRVGRRPLWVLGGASGREYCDNAQALHEHLRRTRPEVDVVWIIDRGASDVAEVSKIGPWVDHRSLAAHNAVRAADVLVFSHGIHDLPGLLSNRTATIVRLGHGLTAFKQTRGRKPRSLERMTRRVDLAPVASEFERENKRTWGFGDHQLPVTGLARWDPMRKARAATAAPSTVLLALTWRDWITPARLPETAYWRNLQEIADRSWFASLLGPADLSMELFLHPLVRAGLRPQLEALDDPPELITRGAEVPEALARSALLVTDYSSLAWDALYLGVPVVFFHFDLDEYLAHRSSLVDLRTRLFGPAATTVEELSGHLSTFTSAGGDLPAWQADRNRWANRAFAFDDAESCERIVRCIEEHQASRA